MCRVRPRCTDRCHLVHDGARARPRTAILSVMPIEPPRESEPVLPWSEVLALFGLASSTGPPEPVAGGWSHNVWRVETYDGVFAVKEIVDNPSAWWIEQIDAAIAFERAAWRSRTIAMAEPLPVSGSEALLGRLSAGDLRRAYRCHRWVDGEPCLHRLPNPAQSARVGTIVARLADLDVWHGTTADQLPWNGLDAYEDTVAEARFKGMDWAPLLGELHPQVAALRQDFAGLAGRAEPMIVTHRDIDLKNAAVIPDGEVAVFDWDYAGPRLLATELLDAAISFAGGPVDADDACMYAAVDAYLEAGGSPVSFDHAAAPLIEEHFRWIMLNAWRSLGHRGVPRVQQEFAGEIVLELAPSWVVSADATRDWAGRLGDR